jgi:hypothetical protein
MKAYVGLKGYATVSEGQPPLVGYKQTRENDLVNTSYLSVRSGNVAHSPDYLYFVKPAVLLLPAG